MKDEFKIWLEQAKDDLKAANDSLDAGNFSWASFQAQQAAEKALKAFLIKKEMRMPRVHDLVFLAKKAGVKGSLLDDCDKLTRVYTETRYPDQAGVIPSRKFDKEMTINHLFIAEEILQWVKKNI